MNILIKRERRAIEGYILYDDTSYFVNPLIVKIKIFPNNRKEMIIYTAFDNFTVKFEEIMDLEVEIDKGNNLEQTLRTEIMAAWGMKQ